MLAKPACCIARNAKHVASCPNSAITMRDVAALRGSRRLSHFSTARNVDGLIFRVRDGYGSFPAAMAATSSQGPDLNRSVAALQAAA
jgi:hypothetical protein